MCVAVAFLASQASPAAGRMLSRSDRAAASWAASASSAPLAYCPAGDLLAAEYAIAENCVVVQTTEEAESLRFDLAWIGGGFLELFGDGFAARLAERRSATLLFDVLSCTTSTDGLKHVIRDAGRGARDVISVSGPAVLVLAPAVERTNYVSRFRRQQARNQLTESHLHANSGVAPLDSWQPVRPRTRRNSWTEVAASLDQRMDSAFGMAAMKAQPSDGPISADPRTCAEHLLRYLVHHGFLRRSQTTTNEVLLSHGPGVSQSSALSSVDDNHVAPAPRNIGRAAARRPRIADDSPARRSRQPRSIGPGEIARVAAPEDRGPRPAGMSASNRRVPRRKVDQTEIP